MKILILTIVIEILAITSLFLNPKKVGKRRKKIIVILSSLFFLGMAGVFYTVFLPTEILVYGTCFLFRQTLERTKKIASKGVEHPEKTREIDKKISQIVIVFLLSIISFSIAMICYSQNSKYTAPENFQTETVKLQVPDDINAILPKFVCLHDSKTETYKFYWEWSNGIYEIDSISSKDADVFADFADDEMPYYEKTTKMQYKMNCNFWWEKLRIFGTKKTYAYKVYVPEYSLKEYYSSEE